MTELIEMNYKSIGKLVMVPVLSLLLCTTLAPVSAELTEEQKELMQMLHNSCQEETGTPEDMITNGRTGNFADDERFKCYLKCLMSQMAVIDDDGVIDVDTIVALLPDDAQAKMEPVMRSCGSIKGANACESAWLANKCYQAGAPDAYMLP